MITTKHELANLLEKLSHAECIALDTEFFWENSYYPVLALIQLSVDRNTHYLVDAVVMDDLSPLGRILSDDRIIKILHDARQDLTILRRAAGAYPRNVFDTQCAAGFAGLSSTLSLGELIKTLSGIKLAKSATRTNWLKRPLTPEQLEYAVDDVRYLPELRSTLMSKIENKFSKACLEEELKGFDNKQLYDDRDPAVQYRRIRGANGLSSESLTILREVAVWREFQGRKRNRPVSWLVKDKTLVAIAREKPKSFDELNVISQKSGDGIKSHTKPLLDAVAKGIQCHLSESMSLSEPEIKNKKDFKANVENMLERIKRKSRHYGIDADLVASKVEAEAFLKDKATAPIRYPRLLCNWRKDLLTMEN